MSVRRMRSFLARSVLAGALAAAVVPAAAAQCLGPDNLDLPGACCQPVVPTLPPFPAASLPGLAVCWGQCNVTSTRPLKVAWTPPVQPICAQYSTQLTVSDGISGLPMLSGTLVLDYTRTWNEVDLAGTITQVWRFAAKADLAAVPGGAVAPCPLPSCIAPVGPFNTAFYYGYVDYTSCTAAGPWENVLVLHHACDRFIHMPILSDKPGVFHPGASFSIVAPHSTAQPFVPGIIPAVGGPLVAEATRDVNNIVPPAFCISEDPVLSGAMTKLGGGCVCTLSPNPKQQTLRHFAGKTQCVNAAGLNGAWTSLNVNFPALPWFDMVTTSIGSWTNPAVYPGQESAWVDEGLFIHQSACSGDFVEIKYGGTTKDGWLAIIPGPTPLTVTNFTDIADNYTAPLNGPYPLPILGSIRQTDHLIYVNEP